MADSNSCQRKTYCRFQMVIRLCSSLSHHLIRCGRLVSRNHISGDAFPHLQNSVDSQSRQNKTSSSLVSPGPHHLGHHHLLYVPCNPAKLNYSHSLNCTLGFPSISLFLLFYSFRCLSLHCHRSKPSPIFEAQLKCQLKLSLIFSLNFLSI